MTNDATLSGKCLCGACSFTAVQTDLGGGICHCGMCRKWSGGMLLSVGCGASTVFEDGALLGSYKGSGWAERVFCKECGSSLMWQTQDGQHQNVSIQAFEDPSQFKLEKQIFIDRKPSNYDLANETAMMTEAEVFAMFAPQGDA